MTEKKPAARARASKPKAKKVQPWPYAKQMAFQGLAQKFCAAQIMGDQAMMAEFENKILEAIKEGKGQ